MSKISVESFVPDILTIIKENSSWLSRFYNVSQFRVQGSDTISFPIMAGSTVQNIAVTAAFTDENAAFTKSSIVLDKKLGRSFTIINPEEDQNLLNTLSLKGLDLTQNIMNQAHTLAATALLAATANASRKVAAVYVGEVGAETIDEYATLVAARAKLKDEGVDVSNLSYIVNSTAEARLLLDPRVMKASSRGDGIDRFGLGYVGRLADVEIFSTNKLSATQAILAHPEALAYDWQYPAPVIENNADARATAEVFSIYNVFALGALHMSVAANDSKMAVQIDYTAP